MDTQQTSPIMSVCLQLGPLLGHLFLDLQQVVVTRRQRFTAPHVRFQWMGHIDTRANPNTLSNLGHYKSARTRETLTKTGLNPARMQVRSMTLVT